MTRHFYVPPSATDICPKINVLQALKSGLSKKSVFAVQLATETG
jgi:hypothetical protein